MTPRQCPRCGGMLWYDRRLDERSCLICGWVYVSPADVARSRAYDEAVRRAGGVKPRRCEVRLPGGG